MSGGVFNYLYFEIENDPLDIDVLKNLESMVQLLEGDDKNDIAQEIKLFHGQIEQFYNQIELFRKFVSRSLTPEVLSLMKTIEWYFSCDCGEESLNESWEKYKNSVEIKD